jgi:hypothetical protein
MLLMEDEVVDGAVAPRFKLFRQLAALSYTAWFPALAEAVLSVTCALIMLGFANTITKTPGSEDAVSERLVSIWVSGTVVLMVSVVSHVARRGYLRAQILTKETMGIKALATLWLQDTIQVFLLSMLVQAFMAKNFGLNVERWMLSWVSLMLLGTLARASMTILLPYTTESMAILWAGAFLVITSMLGAIAADISMVPTAILAIANVSPMTWYMYAAAGFELNNQSTYTTDECTPLTGNELGLAIRNMILKGDFSVIEQATCITGNQSMERRKLDLVTRTAAFGVLLSMTALVLGIQILVVLKCAYKRRSAGRGASAAATAATGKEDKNSRPHSSATVAPADPIAM